MNKIDLCWWHSKYLNWLILRNTFTTYHEMIPNWQMKRKNILETEIDCDCFQINEQWARYSNFPFRKIETFRFSLKLNFVKPPKISTHLVFPDNCFFYRSSDWVEILRGLTKFNFKLNLKVSAFYLEKQKSFIPKKENF